LHCLDQLFQEGTKAASIAVDEFEKLNVPGFDIGSSAFEGRNDNVMLGYNLSQKLRANLPKEISSLIQKPQTMRSLVLELMERIRNG
jgi:hypothetical protein